MSKIEKKKVTILANNWDRFGGRALEILNGYVLSIKLDCEFSFFWPDDHRFPEMEDQIKFFSEDFIEKHRIEACPVLEDIFPIDFKVFDLAEARRFVREHDESQFLKIPDFFSLPKFLDEDDGLARKFYSETAESVISDSVKLLWSKLRKKYSDTAAVHGRYGDLITGSFNQYVDTGKYIDTFSLKRLAEKLVKKNKQVVILSDTPLIVKALEKIIDTTLLPAENKLTEKESVNNFDLQTIELLILASSKNIYAPSSSAFSILASRLGNVPIKYIRQETSDILFFRPWSRRRWRFYNLFDESIRDKVRARDILSLTQCYWKSLDFDRVKSLINEAYVSDDEYVLALCCQAITAKIDSNSEESIALISRAEFFARLRINIHHDPLILTLIVKFYLVKDDNPEASEEIRAEILNLHPYQFSKHNVLKFISESKVVTPRRSFVSPRRTSTRAIWNKIKDEETEVIYGLLKLLRMRI